MLTISEIAQAAKDAVDRDRVDVEVDTRQREVELDVTVALAIADTDRERGVTKRATTTIDEPEVKVVHGKKSVSFALDPLDRGWVATGPGGSKSVIAGAGDVVRAIEAAGLPLAQRGPVPSKLTPGEPKPADTTTGVVR